MSYVAWPSLRPALEQLRDQDEHDEVRRVASHLLEGMQIRSAAALKR